MRGRLRRLSMFVLLIAPLTLLLGCGRSTPSQPEDRGSGALLVGVTEMTFERPSTTTGQTRVLKTIVWYPAASGASGAPLDETLQGVKDAEMTSKGLPLPVIMFSHGSGGEPWQSTYFTAFLASHGFVVVAPAHTGNATEDCHPSCDDVASAADSLLNRPDDILFVLRSFLKLSDDTSSMFFHTLDPARVGMSGYSFGGLTTLQLATKAGNPFKAALAMAPSVVGLQTPAADWTPIPLMLMGGDQDTTCPASRDREYLIALPLTSPHYLLQFPNGTHAAYDDDCKENIDCGGAYLGQEAAHEEIQKYAQAFFSKYLLDDGTWDSALSANQDQRASLEVWLPGGG